MEQDLARRRVGLADALEQGLDGDRAELLAGLVRRGERRVEQLGVLDIVEAREPDIVGESAAGRC